MTGLYGALGAPALVGIHYSLDLGLLGTMPLMAVCLIKDSDRFSILQDITYRLEKRFGYPASYWETVEKQEK